MQGLEQLRHVCGIYLVTNLKTGNQYVGQSVDIQRRFTSHHLCDYNNPNDDCYNTKFYQALRKHGLATFKVEIIEECDREKLNEREMYWIKYYDTFHNGYNSTEGGTSWSPNIHSKETEEKRRLTREKNQSLMSENHPRAKLTNEEVINIRQRYIDGESINQIYQDYLTVYGSQGTFKRIVLGETYRTVGNIPTKEQIAKNQKLNKQNIDKKKIKRLTPDEVRAIRNMYNNGEGTYDSLGQRFGVSAGTIRNVVFYLSYSYID